MKRIAKVFVVSMLMMVLMSTSVVSVASAAPWWANTDDGAYGKVECKDNDITGGTNDKGANDNKKGNCGW
jgi:hypothetical protein